MLSTVSYFLLALAAIVAFLPGGGLRSWPWPSPPGSPSSQRKETGSFGTPNFF